MFTDAEIKVTDTVAFKPSASPIEGHFEEKMTVEKLCELMKWNPDRIPKLANKSYTYKMRKVLGQLTKAELKVAAKREAKELQVKRGMAKIRKLMERIS